jgi:hypothetical protein
MGNLEDSGLKVLLQVTFDKDVLGRYDLPFGDKFPESVD